MVEEELIIDDRKQDSKLKSIINRELDGALSIRTGKLKVDRAKTLQYYKSKPVGDLAAPGIPGRSDVVSTDVHETVEWILPQLIRMMTQSGAICEFVAKNQQAEPLAKHATEYIGNHVFYVQNDGFNILQTAFKDGLLAPNAFVKTYWDMNATDEKETYKGLSDVELQMLTESDDIEILSVTINQTATVDPLEGMEQEPVTYDVTARPKAKGRVKIEVIPPEDVFVSNKAKCADDAKFIAHRFEKTIGELREEGFNVSDDLASNDDRALEMEHWTRYEGETPDQDAQDDPTMRTVVGYECYIKTDYDRDGVPELRKVIMINNEIIDNVEVMQCAITELTAIVNSHEFFGTAPASLAMEAQKQKTQIKRGIIDNLNISINGRFMALDGQANLDDLLNSRPGGVVRVKSMDAVAPLANNPGNLGDAVNILTAIDADKEKRTGLTQFSMGGDTPLITQTATGANIVTNRADARIELIARNYANSIRKVIWKVFRLVTTHQDWPEQIKIGGDWAEIDPREWKNQFNLDVNVGLGVSNRQETQQNLMLLSQAMLQAAQAGVVKPNNVYNAGIKLAEVLNFSNPEQYFSDPGQEPDPQTAQQIQDLQNQLSEGQQMMLQIQQERDTLMLQLNNKNQELETKATEIQLTHQVKMLELQLKEAQLSAEIKLAQGKNLMDYSVKQQSLDLQAHNQAHKQSRDHFGNEMQRGAFELRAQGQHHTQALSEHDQLHRQMMNNGGLSGQ